MRVCRGAGWYIQLVHYHPHPTIRPIHPNDDSLVNANAEVHTLRSILLPMTTESNNSRDFLTVYQLLPAPLLALYRSTSCLSADLHPPRHPQQHVGTCEPSFAIKICHKRSASEILSTKAVAVLVSWPRQVARFWVCVCVCILCVS